MGPPSIFAKGRHLAVQQEALMCWVMPGYLFSLRFVMDTCWPLKCVSQFSQVLLPWDPS